MKAAALALLLLCAVALPAQDFDKPLEKKVVELGPSPAYPGDAHERTKLSCYFFPNFMVKEYDEGEVGAASLSILPLGKGAAPACAREQAEGEMVVSPDDWSGYFKGVRGNLVFFDAPDGVNGGLPFAIFDASTGKKVFEDDAYDSSMYTRNPRPSPFNRLRIRDDRDGGVTLSYLRVVAAECDLHTEKSACWTKIAAQFDLENRPMPACTDYARARGRNWPSAVAYPVEVSLSPQPVTRNIPGPVRCWPAD